MDIITLKYFVKVCENKSFTRSSRELFITQQALSRIIGNLEKEIAAPLFNRSHMGVSLTELGQYLYPKAKAITEAFEDFQEEAYIEAKKQKNNIKMGFSPGTLQVLRAKELMEFTDKYDDINLQISEYSDVACEANILNETLDTAFTVNPQNVVDFHYYPLITDHFVAVVNKNNAIAQKKSISFEDLRDESLILLDDTFRMQLVVTEHFRKAGIKPRVYSRCNHDLNTAYDFVALNKGIFIFVNSLAKVEAYDEIVRIPISVPTAFWDLGFIIKKDKKISQPLKRFMSYFLER
ncbi:MAG: LysR family transcriptional regulator [Pelosinus sp.]|jgi:DNA-binding transcriptional LysR family regulator|nr:LysR family transcriptional regulator [Pelosinus sp.]